jgi:anhydro-N-acetylmuramic acid kinase
MSERWIIGLSAGASLDGVEAALVRIEGAGLELRCQLAHAYHQAYPADVHKLMAPEARVEPAGAPAFSGRRLAILHRFLGETFAVAARHTAEQARMALTGVFCLGFAGHDFWHETEGRLPSTVSLGMAAVVAERTGLTTITDFRARDVTAGGQGTPLTAATDYLLFRHPKENRVLVHLGTVATLVGLPAGSAIRHVVGFQAGPCGILLDGLMRHLTGGKECFDPGGKHAVQGRCVESLLARWVEHPVLQRRPPRSLPRQAFGDDFVAQAIAQAKKDDLSLHDLLCTATHFVARGITDAMKRFLPFAPDRVLLSGGGVRNGFLLHLLVQQLGKVPLETTDAHGVPAQSRKAAAAAGLTALTLDSVPASLPAVTGAGGARLLGSITPGAPVNWAQCLAWMARQAAPFSLAA